MSRLNLAELPEGYGFYFVGIGGISMSALALFLQARGFYVRGSDRQSGSATERLVARGIHVDIGHRADNIEGADALVYTVAVGEDNPERREAERLGLPQIVRGDLLGAVMDLYGHSIGIAGMHGKTTATGMAAYALLHAGMDPTIHIGGEMELIGGSLRLGESDLFLTEACEYTESFLALRPTLAILLNIDLDHLDYFRDMRHIQSAFDKYVRNVPEHGYAVGNGDDPRVRKALEAARCPIALFGFSSDCAWRAVEGGYDERGCARFEAFEEGAPLGEFALRVPGRHNIYNALAAIATARLLGADADSIREGLYAFKGVYRRYTERTAGDGSIVICDYAHHPAAIRALLQSVALREHGRTFMLFQPHTYSRTRALFDDFAQTLAQVDLALIMDIYAAREADDGTVSSQMLVQAANALGGNCRHAPDPAQAAELLCGARKPGDIVLVVGAGDIDNMLKLLL